MSKFENYRNLFLHFFNENFVKATFHFTIVNELVSRNNLSLRVNFPFFHTLDADKFYFREFV